jgi:hypothetical protein
VYGPVRTVVWEGRSREAPPYPDRSDFVHWHFRTCWGNLTMSALEGRTDLPFKPGHFRF